MCLALPAKVVELGEGGTAVVSLEGLRKENHALLVTMLAQLVLAQVRLFQHERRD